MAAPIDFNPYAPEFNPDPFPALRALREQSPIHFWEGGQGWLLSDYDDCITVMRDNLRFSANFQDWELAPAGQDNEFQRVQSKCLFGLPPVDHTRVRKLITPIFSAAAMNRRRDEIRQIIESELDEVGDVKSFDLMSRFAEFIPTRVITRVLGIPREHEAMFKNFASLIVRGATPSLNPEEHRKLNEALPEGLDMLRRLVEERRIEKRDDVLSELVRAEEEGNRLEMMEMLALIVQIISAGSTTTINLIGYCVLAFLRHPAALAMINEKPELLENAVMEVLRYDQFARFGLPRYALEDVEIRGTRIRKGQMILPMAIGVMRDPRKFADPDRFDITRDQRLNLAFGHGPHYCLGAPLARIEGEEAVKALFGRYPNMSLASEPVFEFHPLIRYLQSLHVNTGT